MPSTIAAIATPQGTGGIGVVRLSGPLARTIASRIFRPAGSKELQEAAGHTALTGRVFDSAGDIDTAVALIFAEPRSYTGEDVVEISCHGGMYILRSVLAAAVQAGARLAEPGEFTRRAFVNGKLSLMEAEAVMDLIGAQGASAARAALSAHEGVLGRRIEGIKTGLVGLAAHISAWVDYPEDEVPALESAVLLGSLERAEREMKDLAASYEKGRMIREGVDTVIVGRPNAGKSTLMNLITGMDRSIVTALPGTTRDVVEETVHFGGALLRLADTAGLREIEDEAERIGVDRARKRIRTAELLIALFDASRPLGEEDRALIKTLAGRPAIAVLNKADLEKEIDEQPFVQNKIPYLFICAKSGEGIQELENLLGKVLDTGVIDPSAGILSTERQRDCVRRAAAALADAGTALRAGITLDAVSVSLDEAIAALMELTGERVTEAVVDEVFARFCVGK